MSFKLLPSKDLNQYVVTVSSSIFNSKTYTFGSPSVTKEAVKALKDGANEYVIAIYVDVTTPVGDTDTIYVARRNQGCKNFKVTENLLAKYVKQEKEEN